MLLTWGSYRTLATRFREPYSESAALESAFGTWPAIILPVCARVMFAICAATLSLATAGYAFNEIFVRSFPNLGFSFYLLGALLFVNLLGPKISGMLQRLCLAVAVGGLLALILLALSASDAPPVPASDAIELLPWAHLSGWLSAIWLLIGLISPSGREPTRKRRHRSRARPSSFPLASPSVHSSYAYGG